MNVKTGQHARDIPIEEDIYYDRPTTVTRTSQSRSTTNAGLDLSNGLPLALRQKSGSTAGAGQYDTRSQTSKSQGPTLKDIRAATPTDNHQPVIDNLETRQLKVISDQLAAVPEDVKVVAEPDAKFVRIHIFCSLFSFGSYLRVATVE